MNHLAHLFLSGNDEHLMAGNFMGDHVKGRDFSMYPERVAAGIRLHRMIDSYTDTHPVVNESKKKLRPVFRKYAPVVADMYYDHFLASRWDRYSGEPLPAFARRTYRILSGFANVMPVRTARFLDVMIRHDWLTGYASLDGMGAVLEGMAQRAKFTSNMEQAAGFLEMHYEAFGDDFESFFPELQAYVIASKSGILHKPD